jgi:hypothetical protein
MPNEYNNDKIVLRDTSGNQMSLPRFFQLALTDGSNGTTPYAGPSRMFNTWIMETNLNNTVPVRTPVYGTVSDCGSDSVRGTFVKIDEGNGRVHQFESLASGSLQVVAGDQVNQGDMLGYIGNTGYSPGTNPHLSYVVLDSGGTELPDPINAFDNTTLPAGWTMDGAASAGNWDYIQLDRTATDYGPPGGDVPSEPFFTDQPCYDISHPQGGNAINPIIQSQAGGVIIGVGRFGWDDGQGHSGSDGYVEQTTWPTDIAAAKGNIPFGLYFYSYIKASEYEQYGFEQGLTSLQNAGITPADVSMGIWIDIEDAITVTTDKARNFALVQKFCNTFLNAGYPLVGLYSMASGLRNWYNQSDLAEFPLWAAAIGDGQITFANATRDNPYLTNFLPEDLYKNVYLFQYSWVQRVAGYNDNLDGDRVLLPMPTEGGGGGGGGGGDYTEVINVTVEVIAPKRIYFSPNPGIIQTESELLSERTATIEITTDADNAYLYYTTDGSAPYQYTPVLGGVVNAVAANALLYDEPIVINKDTHIRVVAVPAGKEPGDIFEKPLAKGSGTYLFEYHNLSQEWEEEQKSYATSDDNTSFFEENLQAFLRVHAELTEEEVLYTDVYTHDSQVEEEDAKDDASTTDSDEPIPIPPETESEQVGD